jgi:hypothetical protein
MERNIMNVPSNDPIIVCPKCSAEIRLTESLAAPILAATKREYEKKLAHQEKVLQDREQGLLTKEAEIRKKSDGLDAEIQRRLKAERENIVKEEAQRARLALRDQIQGSQEEVAELKKVITERDKKLEEARRAQTEIKRKERALEDARREIELTVESRVNNSLEELRSNALKEAEGKLKLRITEKEETIASMQRQIEVLKQKAEQGSQQIQGEAQEIELESILRTKFPGDIIEAVSKGISGGDVLQRVLGPHGQSCGTIIWESKRTMKWSDGWLTKLRKDQRDANADAAILVSEALPKGLETFDLLSGVWVTEFRYVIAVATAIRHALVELSAVRKAEEGQQTKMEMVYQYLTGQRFRQRVNAIVEQFTEMQADLDRERRATVKLWAKREQQIRGVIESTAGMYGDLQGIAGRSLQEIEGLDYKLRIEPRKLRG